MANKALFTSIRGTQVPAADTVNEAGGRAYRFSDKQALAQFTATGCMNATFYASAEVQLSEMLKLCEKVEPEFLAKTALYMRHVSHMKDMPALICAVLSVKSPGLMAEIFDRVIDSPKMLRNFVQIMRSGVVGRKSLGSLPKRLILQWLESRSDESLFRGAIGNDPSLADIIKMVHPKPKSDSRSALYGYLIGREYQRDHLPELVKQYEKFKRNTNPGKVRIPDVPFQLLTSLPLTKKDWKQIARQGTWQMTRMNLNTFYRHEVFNDQEMLKLVSNRLRNPKLIEESRVFPYQLMAAWLNINQEMHWQIKEALQDALELSLKNVPRIKGKVFVCPDVSGSMHSPVTGFRQGSTTAVRCIDVAALVGAAILRKNRDAELIPFKEDVVKLKQLNPRDSVMTNAKVLSSLPAGGTNCSASLKALNRRKAKGDLVIYVSDNESWIDSRNYGWGAGGATATMNEWNKFKKRNPKAKMICIDIQPYSNTQAKEREDIINVGGFSDQVFRIIADVANGQFSKDHWVNTIEQTRI